jgi:ActR/RegA family two-component response regulator
VTRVASILVVDDDAALRRWFQRVLSEAGYRVVLASTYEAGQLALRTEPPDLLIADVRLGPHNGLQLVASGPPGIATIIVTGFADVVLEADAVRMGAHYLIKPMSVDEVLTLVHDKLESRQRRLALGSTRRWDRKIAAPAVRAEVGSATARLIDASYGGVRLEVALVEDSLPRSFLVEMANAAAPIVVDLVWMRRLDPHRLSVGASISWHDTAAVHDWKEFVDTLPTDPST